MGHVVRPAAMSFIPLAVTLLGGCPTIAAAMETTRSLSRRNNPILQPISVRSECPHEQTHDSYRYYCSYGPFHVPQVTKGESRLSGLLGTVGPSTATSIQCGPSELGSCAPSAHTREAESYRRSASLVISSAIASFVRHVAGIASAP